MTNEEAIIELIYSGKYDDLTCKEARELFEELIKENRCEDECVSKGKCNHNEACLDD